jgi:hypothetical protein
VIASFFETHQLRSAMIASAPAPGTGRSTGNLQKSASPLIAQSSSVV